MRATCLAHLNLLDLITYALYPLLRSCQRKSAGPRQFETFRNKLLFYGEVLLAPRPTPNWRTTPSRLSATSYSKHSQLPSVPGGLPSVSWGRAMPWWQGTHLTWQLYFYIYLSVPLKLNGIYVKIWRRGWHISQFYSRKSSKAHCGDDCDKKLLLHHYRGNRQNAARSTIM
jgi:hypothetical protein